MKWFEPVCVVTCRKGRYPGMSLQQGKNSNLAKIESELFPLSHHVWYFLKGWRQVVNNHLGNKC